MIFKIPPSFSAETLLHLCRHFSSLPPEEIQSLQDKGFTLQEIQKEFSLPGSKFHNPPFSGLNALVQFIQYNWSSRLDLSEKKDILTSTWNLSKAEYPQGIGTDGIVAIQSLNVEEKNKIYHKDRKGTIVNAYPTQQVVISHSLVLISKISEKDLSCITIYPGTYAPPFPDPSMEADYYNLCKEFWNKHALIESA